MLTILFHMTVKAGLEEKCSALAKELTASTRAEDKGCLNYSFFRRWGSYRAVAEAPRSA
jgi:quinol monooxygenase YgiN